MKKRFLFYVSAFLVTFSLQSCVTNYVVAEPSTFNKEYKTSAKTESDKYGSYKKELINSFISDSKTKIASIDNSLKNAEAAFKAKRTQAINTILTEAETYLGTPYRLGGMTRNGIDCSAFVLSVFGAATGMALPRVAAAQSQEGEKIEKENLQKGDLIFFSQGRGRISHVGIVYDVNEEGDIKFIHSATSKGVTISSLSDSYWSPKYRFAKRIVTDDFLNNPENTLTQLN